MSIGGLALGLVGTLAGAVLVYHGASNLRPAYRVFAEDPVSVRDLVYQDGPVEVRGTAKPHDGQGVEAPFSGTACLVCEYETEEWQSSGNSGSRRTLDEGSMAAPFLVEDDTGTVRVDGQAATLHVYGGVESAPPGEWGTDLVDAVVTDSGTDLVVSDTTERGTAWRMARRPLLWVLAGIALVVFGGGLTLLPVVL